MAAAAGASSGPDKFDAILRSVAGRRYTQDSPILPEVWVAYRENPQQARDLLITPHLDARTGQVAQELRAAVESGRGNLSARDDARVAHIPGIIAVKLYFDEVIRLVLTRTPWWRRRTSTVTQVLRGATTNDAELLPFRPEDVKSITAALEDLATGPSAGAITPHGELPPDFLLVVALAGELLRRQAGTKAGTKSAKASKDTDFTAQVRAFCALFDGSPDDARAEAPSGTGKRAGIGVMARRWPADDYERHWPLFAEDTPNVPHKELARRSMWRVSLNRDTQASITKSALAVKADAARRLFDVSCKDITWAVIDSGIDSNHPAFWDWAAPAGADGTRPPRVIRTYDFTRVRELLQVPKIADLFAKPQTDLSAEEAMLKQRYEDNLKFLGVPDPKAEAPRYARQLKARLEGGLEIDWSLLEPFLLIKDAVDPLAGHGTHVAGILGADWRKPDPTVPANAAIVMQGVCPDIRLLDMRVLGSDGATQEFEVIAALQFIRYLNSRADLRVVHGANLSLSTIHRVESYACGSTPICEECDRVWASGVVLVAAAGNYGHQNYLVRPGVFDQKLSDALDEAPVILGGYHSISITDPGNAEGVITVGATHRIQPHQYGVSYFSSRGPTGDGRRKPDLVAPGEKIDGPLPFGGRGTGDGTSLAAPHVSGAAAMLMARYNELIGRPVKIKKILCDTATDLGREPYFQGAGMLDILRALQSV
jgi:subtilisin family serine protease